MPVRTRSQFIDDEAVLERRPRAPRVEDMTAKEVRDILMRQGVSPADVSSLIKLMKKNKTVAEKKEQAKRVQLKKSIRSNVARRMHAHGDIRASKFAVALTDKNPAVKRLTTCIYETRKKKREGINEIVKTPNINAAIKPFYHKGKKQYRLSSECPICGHSKSTFLSKELAGGKLR